MARMMASMLARSAALVSVGTRRWRSSSRRGPSCTNPFASDTLTFQPNGSASESGSVIFTNPDGYTRSLSVVRPTGMVTVQ